MGIEEDIEKMGDSYVLQHEFYETVYDGDLLELLSGTSRINLVDVGQIMIDGVQKPQMLVEGWIVEKELHWIAADAAAGKTWLALWLSIDVMKQGKRVLYFDEELGENVIAERLMALRADPFMIKKLFAYHPFPGWQMSDEDRLYHRIVVRDGKPALVVYDTATDMLSEANLDENKGIDVTRWVKAYPEEARRAGAAQLVLDHHGHSEKTRSVGSRAKRAKAKVEYGLTSAKPIFGEDNTGEVTVTLEKNTRGAALEKERIFTVGGTPFIWELAPEVVKKGEGVPMTIEGRVLNAITPNEEFGMNATQITEASKVSRAKVDEILRVLIARGDVHTKKGPNNSNLCWRVF